MSTKKEPKNRKKKHQLITKGHGNEPTVIEFNLSKAVILLIIIGVIIAGLVTKEIVTTIIKARQNKVLAEETSDENAVYVQSSDGIQVPVLKGYNKASSTAAINIVDAEPDGVLDGDSDSIADILFTNSAEFQLPVTGGMGTVIFAAGGILFVCVGTVLLMVTVKRKRNK